MTTPQNPSYMGMNRVDPEPNNATDSMPPGRVCILKVVAVTGGDPEFGEETYHLTLAEDDLASADSRADAIGLGMGSTSAYEMTFNLIDGSNYVPMYFGWVETTVDIDTEEETQSEEQMEISSIEVTFNYDPIPDPPTGSWTYKGQWVVWRQVA